MDIIGVEVGCFKLDLSALTLLRPTLQTVDTYIYSVPFHWPSTLAYMVEKIRLKYK